MRALLPCLAFAAFAAVPLAPRCRRELALRADAQPQAVRRRDTERVRGRYTDEEWENRVSTFPMGRAAEPEEIARAALFLVQDENRYVTGQTIHVNGGCLMW